MGFLLILRHLVFIVFFIWTSVWRFSLIPLLVGVGLMLYASPKETREISTGVSRKNFLNDHLITISWLLVMVGLRGFLDILVDSSLMIGVWLIGANLIFRLGSYLFSYEDGKQVFHYGWYFSSILLFISIARIGAFDMLLDVVLLRLALTMAVYAFIVFVLEVVTDASPKNLQYPLFITFNCCILYLIYYYTQQTVGLSLVVAQGYLLLLYGAIWQILYQKNETGLIYQDDEDALFRHVLSGQKITRFKEKSVNGPIELVDDLKRFLVNISSGNKTIIGLLNIGLVVGQVILFVMHMQQGTMPLDFIWLWAGVLLFGSSFVLLRSIGFAYKLQRVIAFVVINIALYLTIISVFGNNIVYIVALGIIWTIINALLVMQHRTIDPRGYLTRQDYFYRVIGIGFISLCNIYFMINLPLSLQLVFSLISFYVGLQVFMIRYALKAIKR